MYIHLHSSEMIKTKLMRMPLVTKKNTTTNLQAVSLDEEQIFLQTINAPNT